MPKNRQDRRQPALENPFFSGPREISCVTQASTGTVIPYAKKTRHGIRAVACQRNADSAQSKNARKQ